MGAGKGAGPLSDGAPNWGGERGEASGNRATMGGSRPGGGAAGVGGVNARAAGVDAAKDWVRGRPGPGRGGSGRA